MIRVRTALIYSYPVWNLLLGIGYAVGSYAWVNILQHIIAIVFQSVNRNSLVDHKGLKITSIQSAMYVYI